MKLRHVENIITARPTSDGAGVKLKRISGFSKMKSFDPFLLLDEINADESVDYIGGFPSHPHRGFETVTYMLEGKLQHEDHLGNRGLLEDGGVQWMTAGRGIIHSEMPQQTEGRMRGFQLWLNLPAADKMVEPGYRDVAAMEMPPIALPGGGSVKVIAGQLEIEGQSVEGMLAPRKTEPHYFDVHLSAGEQVDLPVKEPHTVLAYAYEGEVGIGGDRQLLSTGQLGQLFEGDTVRLVAGENGSQLLLLTGVPLAEPVAHYGPFVMNTDDEIEQALRDYRDGKLAV